MARQIYDDVLVAVLAGGRGSRLGALTRGCAKPALPFGGRYRILDFVLSNCVNSGMSRIGLLTQYQAYSLIHYVNRSWQGGRINGGQDIEIWPADQRNSSDWYKGTADALYQNLDIIAHKAPKHVLVLAADHVYKMDYRRLIDFHFMRGADMTVACVEFPKTECKHFGIMAVDDTQQIVKFSEKPAEPVGLVNRHGRVLVSMGVYVFNTDTLLDALSRDAASRSSSHDFGHNVIPTLINDPQRLIAAYSFRDRSGAAPGYWRDIGTVDSYWRAHMDLVQPDAAWDVADLEWPLHGGVSELPPPRLMVDPCSGEPTVSINAMVSDGCVLSGTVLRDCVLFSDVQCKGGAVLDRCVVLPGARIGSNCRLTCTVVGMDCTVPDGTVTGVRRDADQRRFDVSENGVVLISRESFEETPEPTELPERDVPRRAAMTAHS